MLFRILLLCTFLGGCIDRAPTGEGEQLDAGIRDALPIPDELDAAPSTEAQNLPSKPGESFFMGYTYTADRCMYAYYGAAHTDPEPVDMHQEIMENKDPGTEPYSFLFSISCIPQGDTCEEVLDLGTNRYWELPYRQLQVGEIIGHEISHRELNDLKYPEDDRTMGNCYASLTVLCARPIEGDGDQREKGGGACFHTNTLALSEAGENIGVWQVGELRIYEGDRRSPAYPPYGRFWFDEQCLDRPGFYGPLFSFEGQDGE